TGVGQHTKSQTQILAGSSESTVSAKATAVWARSGAIPAVSARQNCAKGGVDVTVANKGDAPFTYTLAGREHTVASSATKTITVPAREDQAYRFTLVGPDGLEKTFTGALDCQTVTEGGRADDASTVAGGGAPSTARPSPAAADGPTGDEAAVPESGDLADTGSGSPVALIAGIAGGLLVVGGGALFLVRRKRATSSSEPGE
ncbi:LAETG motif-containing sortase-dependent surface protein, partial [Streptomyces sp. AC627_RSS907]